MLTAPGAVNGKKVKALRDTGCRGCFIRRSFVSVDQLVRKEPDAALIDETLWRLLILTVNFSLEKTEALCMDDTLYDLVIGNIDGSKRPDMSRFLPANVTRSQAKQSEKAYRTLKVSVQIIKEA